jgi:peptidoglycan/LPS O-acetylase OafA/YrhL
MSQTYTDNRNFGLDVIRALSIILVLLSHTFVFDSVELGVWGVEVFFVLSGFLIGQILIRDFQNGITLKGIVHFWKRRWYRTLPLYYAVILIKFIFFDSSLGWKIIAYVFFLQNNFVGISFFGVSWSLVIEEWFYLLFPLGFLILFRKGFTPRVFLVTVIALILGFIALRTGWVLYSHRTFDGIRPNFIFRFDSLLIGVFLAHIKMHYNSVYYKLGSIKWFLLGLLLMLFLIFDIGKIHTDGLSKADSHVFYRTLWFALFSFSVFLIIPFFESNNFIKKAASIKPLFYFFTWTSILTYSIYLIHMFVFQIPVGTDNPFLVVPIHFLLLYGCSYLIFRFYEHPMMSLRDKPLFKRKKLAGQL